MAAPIINGKPIQFVGTAGWSEKCAMYIKVALDCLAKHPVDMLVFEQPKDGVLQVRSAGYDLATDSKLDETTVIFSMKSLPVQKFWQKIDNYGETYVATFLFPDEY